VLLFQSTPPRGGANASSSLSSRPSCFNPRPCVRGDDVDWTIKGNYHLFQSTPPREGRPAIKKTSALAPAFQSTPLREGRRYFPWSQTSLAGFNPRPCVRGDCSKAGRFR